MSNYNFEPAIGVIDGVNRVFTVSSPYIVNSTTVFFNGTPHRRNNTDGWVETSPLAGVVTLNEAPLIDDDIQIFYAIDDSANTANNVTIVTEIHGTILATNNYKVLISEPYEFKTNLVSDILNSNITDSKPIFGRITEETSILGIISKEQ